MKTETWGKLFLGSGVVLLSPLTVTAGVFGLFAHAILSTVTLVVTSPRLEHWREVALGVARMPVDHLRWLLFGSPDDYEEMVMGALDVRR